MRKIYISILSVAVTMLMVARVAAQYSEPTLDVNVPPTQAAIVMDGEADASYSDDQTLYLAKAAGAALSDYGVGFDAADFDAKFKFCWDYNYLYLWATIVDDVEESLPEGGGNQWTWDNVEAFIDIDTNSTMNGYGATSTAQYRFNRGDFGGVTNPVRGLVADFRYVEINEATGWTFEVSIPWYSAGDSTGASTGAAFATTAERIKAKADAGEPLGFDFAAADADGAGGGTEGGRNVEGGQQMFWDKDTPIGNEDNAYQNRRVFGWIRLTGTPVGTSSIINPVASVYGINYNNDGSVTLTNLDVNRVDVYNLVGAKVATYNVTGNTLRIADLAKGVYVARIKETSVKFVK